MLDEEEIALEARLIAIEHLLTHLAKATYLTARLSDDQVQVIHGNMRQSLQEETFPNADVDPSLKDHFAATIYENVDRLLAEFERALTESRAPGAPS